MTWDQVVMVAAGIVTVGAALTFLHRLMVRPLVTEAREWFTWWKKFQRDWDGTEAEPGRAAVPGVMARLNEIDGELKRNGGGSLKDQVVKTREQVEHIDSALRSLQADFTAHTETQRG